MRRWWRAGIDSFISGKFHRLVFEFDVSGIKPFHFETCIILSKIEGSGLSRRRVVYGIDFAGFLRNLAASWARAFGNYNDLGELPKSLLSIRKKCSTCVPVG